MLMSMNFGSRWLIIAAAGLLTAALAFVSWTVREMGNLRLAVAVLAHRGRSGDPLADDRGQLEAVSRLLGVRNPAGLLQEDTGSSLAAYLRDVKIVDNRDGKRGPLTLTPGRSYDSEGQPAAILKHMQGKKNGTFLEAGANDGEFQPSTLLLERDHGWTGILIEPVPGLYQKLLATNRRAMIMEGCISPKPYPYLAEMLTRNNLGLGDHPSSHLNGLAVNAMPESADKVMVECYPLIDILKAAGMLKLDVLCLDVQGPELQILQTLPWEMVDIQLLVLENDHRDINAQQALFNATAGFLATKGYKFVERVAWDFFFMKDNSTSVSS